MFTTLKNQIRQRVKIAFPLVSGCFLLLVLIGSISPVSAQDTDDGETSIDSIGFSNEENEGDEGGDFGSRVLRDRDTFVITRELGNANEFCGVLDPAYRVDCLANQYEQIAKSLPNRGDYVPIKTQLISAAEELAALARANQDPVLPVVRPKPKSTSPKAKTTRALVPVSKKRIAAVEKAAVKIIEETQTILLRSAENSRRRKIPYTKIAAAIGSNKVLLRSA